MSELSDLGVLWRLACEYDGVDETSSFVIFTDDNPYIQAHEHLTKKINTRIRIGNRSYIKYMNETDGGTDSLQDDYGFEPEHSMPDDMDLDGT